MALSQLTLLDAARQHFQSCARSPSYTRPARNMALKLERECEAELGLMAAKLAGHSPNPIMDAIANICRPSMGLAA